MANKAGEKCPSEKTDDIAGAANKAWRESSRPFRGDREAGFTVDQGFIGPLKNGKLGMGIIDPTTGKTTYCEF